MEVYSCDVHDSLHSWHENAGRSTAKLEAEMATDKAVMSWP